jgi:hypothetical protein
MILCPFLVYAYALLIFYIPLELLKFFLAFFTIRT